ncbi:MAG: hypothetical protein LC754_06355 [Acidobacteria bacterium]|nr:hypothetical protein [Acidobacteriota bacterium]
MMKNNPHSKHTRAVKSASAEGHNAPARAARPLVLYVMLGALALGVLPSVAGGFLSAAAKQAKDVAAGAKVKSETRTNLAPLRAFLARARQLKDQGKLDLSAPRAITVEGDRAEDGTLSNISYTGASAANPTFRKVAQDFVVSLNTSHALNFLQDVSHVRMTFTLDGERFTTQTASDTPSDKRAEEMARGYRSMINIGRIMKRGSDEAVVLNNMKVSASGKQLVMNLDMPRETLGNILLKQITPN